MNTALFWNERLSHNYSLQGVGYSSLGLGMNKWLYAIRRALFDKVLCGIKPTTVLDIGAGTGFYSDILANKGFKVTSSDISPFAAQQLSRYEGIEYDISSKPLNRSFETVIAIDVLFHIIDDDKYLRAFENIYSMLPVGGTLIFSENAPKNRITVPHQVMRTRTEIDTILHQTGFETVDVQNQSLVMSYDNALKWWWKLVLKLSPRLGSILGAFVYGIDVTFAPYFGDSTKVFICKKI